ncbi:putative Fe-S cluster-containing radical SAM superfamily protein [Chryseobacterium vietnamense]|uniref:Fe-S cluster-containing radical SAM superfamily protein n=1 Tax=Chryseobacterium vietnamense TaxID=866785 RepID=A0ACC6J821_9FLAO|nr:hypothetical protein [Chryseobacterium vietnamense]MDR6459063.1 putative Fe-S cluster-containing radical SAM superfamily protein [Chryseobacterium vietnamense]
MKSILIIGASNAGKSTTAQEVCRQLKPNKVFRLDISKEELNDAEIENIFNNTFIIEVNGKLILIVAGATTEQGVKITAIIDVCIKLKLDISFALVSMRSFERTEGFDTKNQLSSISEILLEERIYKINEADFRNSKEWKSRIEKIVRLIKANI